MRILFIDPVDFLVSGVRDLLGIFGELDLGLERAVIQFHSRKLVNAAKGRIVLRGDQVRAHAEGINARALLEQGIDQILVKVIGAGDLRLRITRVIEHLPRLLCKISKIAGIQTDTDVIDRQAFFFHIIESPDRVRNTAL